MAYEQDYIMRQIKDMVRAIAKVATGKETPVVTLPADNKSEDSAAGIYEKLLRMADAGEINEAENLLLESLDTGNQEHLQMALAFYSYLNEFTGDFLEEHSYTREEIAEGIESVSESFGLSGFGGIMTYE